MLVAITRKLARSILECELTFVDRAPFDYELALAQHLAYETVLSGLGVEIDSMKAEESMPDSVFVEDTALVLPELAVLLSPRVRSRQMEVESIEDVS